MPSIISRDDAWQQGRKRYYLAKPCAKGHDCERYTSNGGCVDCQLRTARPGPPVHATNVRVLPPMVFRAVGVDPPTEAEIILVGERVQQLVDSILAGVRADTRMDVPLARTVPDAPPGHRMTAKAGPAGYAIYHAGGWTDAQLVDAGFMEPTR